MSDDNGLDELGRVVGRIMKTVEMHDQIGKAEFEAILRLVVEEVHHNTGIALEEVALVTGKVVGDMPASTANSAKSDGLERR